MEFNEKQALQVIEEMISKTKSDMKDNSFYYLLWGWIVFVAAITNYYLLEFTNFEYHSIPWMILIPIGIIITIIGGIRSKKEERVKTYIGSSMKYIITAFWVSIMVISFTMPMGDQWKAFYPTFMVLYAIWLYISGGILKFKPFIYGAVLNWILAGVCYIWHDSGVHLLFISLAVLGGYIIPGYMLKMSYNRNVQRA